MSRRISSREALRFLTQVGSTLASSLDPAVTLRNVARLAIPRVACYCTVDILGDDGRLERVAAAHIEPGREGLLASTADYPLDPAREGRLARALRERESVLLDEVTDDWLREVAHDERHFKMIRELAATSLMLVPLAARDRLLGVLLLASTRTDRHYGPSDLTLAEEMARLSALAIDNSRLHERARRAVADRDEVLGVVSHDLRNPVGRVLMASQLLQDPEMGADDPATRATHLKIIERAAASMNRLIDDLLDASRIEAGQLSVEARPIPARELVREAAEALRPHAEAAGITLEVDAAEGLPLVLADRERVLQVFANLVGNAVKFTPQGGKVVLRAEPAGGGVRFEVRDNGLGVPADQLPRLFDRFWQAHRGDRRGAGLGLAIVRGIVEAHGGTVEAESEEGRGTAMRFVLPRPLPHRLDHVEHGQVHGHHHAADHHAHHHDHDRLQDRG